MLNLSRDFHRFSRNAPWASPRRGVSGCLVFWAMALALALCGCRCNQDDEDAPLPKEKEPTPKTASQILADFVTEDLDDPAFYASPRVQYTWAPPGVDEVALWSVKTNGDDLRLVAGHDLLYKQISSAIRGIKRSPDRRYLIFSGNCIDKDRFCTVLVDLRGKSGKVICNDANNPHFQWTADSRSVLFYQDIQLKMYHLDKDWLEERPMIYSQGLYMIPSSKQLLAINATGYSFLSFEGKLQKEVLLGFEITPYHFLTSDGKYLLYRRALHPEAGGHWTEIIDTAKPKQPLFGLDDIDTDPVLSPDGKTLFGFTRGELTRVDIATGEKRSFGLYQGSREGDLNYLDAVPAPGKLR